MKYKIWLKCVNCNRQSDAKDCDTDEATMNKNIQICNMALKMPQHLICPQCHGLLSVKVMLAKIK